MRSAFNNGGVLYLCRSQQPLAVCWRLCMVWPIHGFLYRATSQHVNLL